jgi:Ran GTPase-activating protein (RanGAP) involved in mRNA processing and transport
LNIFIIHFLGKYKNKDKMFSTIIEFVLCLNKLKFNTLQLLSETSKDVKNEIDNMQLSVILRLNKLIISESITTRYNIISLDFTIFTMSDITEEYLKILLQLILQCNAITKINLRNNRIGSEGAKKLATVLLANGLTLESPNETVLLANRLTLESPNETVLLANRLTLESPNETVLRQCNCLAKLELLNLTNNKIGPEGMESLATVLENCNALTTLDLSENEFGDTGIKYLEQLLLLGRLGSLIILNLREIQIGPIGAGSLASMLQCSFLTHLDISNNNIGPIGLLLVTRNLIFLYKFI